MFIRTILILLGLMMLNGASAHDKGHHGYQSKSVGGHTRNKYSRKHSNERNWGNNHRHGNYKYRAYRPRRYIENCYPTYRFYMNGVGFSVTNECAFRERIYLDDRWHRAYPRR